MEHASPETEGGGEKTGKVLMVILVGAPGSGKSTFCENVMRASRRPWVRICQDSIANGKAGTKLQCVKCATDAIKAGKSVFIDRCNLDRDQRADFVKLGGPLVDVHATVLDLPTQLCISRSVKRSGHEGNLQGGRAAAVVNKMLQNRELPKLDEGYSRITICQNEADVQNAVNLYCALGPSDTLSSGCFGEKSSDSKVQRGIMKFFKRVEKPKELPSDKRNSWNSTPEKGRNEKVSSSMHLEKMDDDKKDKETTVPFSGDWASTHTLAFPSISTADFQFNHEKASDIIIESVADFLDKHDNVRLALVDLSHKSNILSLVKAKAKNREIDSKRFLTYVGDITRLSTEGNLQCSVIANSANWRLKPGGGGVNAAIYKAAGEDLLAVATKERADHLTPGSCVVVPLPSCSPLYQREGVTHVIHVLGPNMNPQRPDCLQDDYVKGGEILRDAYSSLFDSFMSIVQCPATVDSNKLLEAQFSESKEQPNNEGLCTDTDLKNKRVVSYELQNIKKSRGEQKALLQGNETKSIRLDTSREMTQFPHRSGMPNVELEVDTAGRPKKTWYSWAQALYQTAMNPEQQKDSILEVSDDFVVLDDLYPKAKRHVLVLSRLSGLDRLADVRKEHLPLLKKMHEVGQRWSVKFLNEDSSLIFRLGYHSVPSMRQLHLHVISQDFNSEHLKNKRHWNSFNTAFFRDSADVLEDVENLGFAKLNDEKLLSMELRCHRCRSAHPTIPKLKYHLGRCGAPFPTHLVQGGRLIGADSAGLDARTC